MITRIVKVTLLPGKREDFIALFKNVFPSIKNAEGCLHVEILLDCNHDQIAFTYSQWRSEEDLNNYRNSSLFEGTWAKARLLFAQKAEAWSMQQVIFNVAD